MGFRTGLDDVEERKVLPTPGLELRSLCRPARSQISWLHKKVNSSSLQTVTESQIPITEHGRCVSSTMRCRPVA
jgi:hypothetical protein